MPQEPTEPPRDTALGPQTDGRQSEAAHAIARGTSRCLAAHGFAVLPELTLASGRRADLTALAVNGTLWIIEIKSSLADFRADQKWPDYRAYCDALFFAVDASFPCEILPADCGLILADRYGAEIVRKPPVQQLAAARRKAVIQGFARTAALRLHQRADPDFRQDT